MSTSQATSRYVVAERARRFRLRAGLGLVVVALVHTSLLAGHGVAWITRAVMVVLVLACCTGQLVRLGAIVLDEWRERDRDRLPRYGVWPRLAASVAAHVIGTLWLLGLVVGFAVLVWPGRHGGDPGPFVAALRTAGAAVFLSCVLVAFVCLPPWLVAEGVVGYREPRRPGRR